MDDNSEVPSLSKNSQNNEQQENRAATTFKRTKSFHDRYDLVQQSPSATSTSSSSSTYSSTNDVIRRKYSQGSSLIPDDSRNIRPIGMSYFIINFYIASFEYGQSKVYPKC